MNHRDDIDLIVAAHDTLSPSELTALLRSEGTPGLERLRLSPLNGTATEAAARVDLLRERGVGAIPIGSPDYPKSLSSLRSPPPVLYFAGNRRLLSQAAVGMCGSRSASEAGLRAAEACGTAVAREGLVVVSGYARGVDTATHLAALRAGGQTILVLPEGMLRFRVKSAIADDLDEDRVLVVSQFRVDQRWHVGNAMARNETIAALGSALVVIEAREEGGTLDAGLRALVLGRPVIALQFDSGPTPPGNEILHGKGAIAVRRPGELVEVLRALAQDPTVKPGQLELLLKA